MDKYIKESDLFKRILNVDFKHDYDGCIKFCQSIPAADVEEVVKEWCYERNCIIVAREDFPRLEVRHGRWEDVEPAPHNLFYGYCEECLTDEK